MNAGNLKYRIYIYKPVKQTSAYGNEKITYEMKCSCRASVTDGTSLKTQDLDEATYNQYKTLQVYDYVDVEEEDRIKYNDKMYFITSINSEPTYHRKNIVITLVNS